METHHSETFTNNETISTYRNKNKGTFCFSTYDGTHCSFIRFKWNFYKYLIYTKKVLNKIGPKLNFENDFVSSTVQCTLCTAETKIPCWVQLLPSTSSSVTVLLENLDPPRDLADTTFIIDSIFDVSIRS